MNIRRSRPHRIHHQKLYLALETLATAENCQESAALKEVLRAASPLLKSCDRDTPRAVSLALRVSAFERWVFLLGSSMWM